jgi:hypothetical protein
MLVGKLEKTKLYNLTSDSGHVFKHLCFEGFENEDGNDVAIFSDPVSQEFYSFNINSREQIMIEFA